MDNNNITSREMNGNVTFGKQELLDLGFAKVIVEFNNNHGYKDAWISLEDANGNFIQDLTHVGNKVICVDENIVQQDDIVVVHVWEDPDSESYTYTTEIKKYVE